MVIIFITYCLQEYKASPWQLKKKKRRSQEYNGKKINDYFYNDWDLWAAGNFSRHLHFKNTWYIENKEEMAKWVENGNIFSDFA